MYAIIASVLAASSLARAASTIDSISPVGLDIRKIPQCALRCLISAAGSTTCSSVTDTYCLCTTGASDIVKSLIPCMCSSTCSQQELVDTLTVSNGVCVAAFEAKGEKFNPPSPDPNLCQEYAGGAGKLPTPASGPDSTMSMSGMAPPASPPSGYEPKTNMTPPATNTTGATNTTNTTDTSNKSATGTTSTTSHTSTASHTSTTSHNASNSSVPASNTGGAANIEAGMRMLGTAILVAFVGAALATL